MVFGRKKKELEVVEEPQDDNQLDLEVNDDFSSEDGDSVPPPPPGAATKQNLLIDDSHTIEDSPSIEANDVGISMLSDPDPNSSIEEKKEPDSNRHKKMFIFFSVFVSFIILLGLAIKYGSYHKQSKSSASSGLDDMDVGGSSNSPILDDEEEDVTLSIPEIPVVQTVVQETIEDVGPNITEQKGTSIGVDTIPGNSTDSEKTVVPTTDSAVDITEVATTIGSPDGTADVKSDGTSDATTPNFDIVTTSNDDIDEFTETECVVDQIFATSSCENEVASVSISMCIAEETSDQFWAWIEIPQAYAPFQERDWGWVRDGTDTEITGIPEGRYVLGLYSNGGEVMNEYPLMTSSEFIIICN